MSDKSSEVTGPMDPFVTPVLRAAIRGGDLNEAWTAVPLRQEKLRLLVYLAREAPRRERGGDVHPTTAYEVGTRGAKAIRGWDPKAPRNDAGVRRLLHAISDALPEGTFNIDRYTPPGDVGAGGVPRPQGVAPRRTEISSIDLPEGF